MYIRWPDTEMAAAENIVLEWTECMQEKICPNFSLNRPKFYCSFSDAYKTI